MQALAATPSALADPNALRVELSRGPLPEDQKVAAAARQFEAVFVRQFLQEALEPVFTGFLPEGQGNGGEMYRYFFADALAQNMSQREVFGFASALQAQVQPYTAPGGLHDNLTEVQK